MKKIKSIIFDFFDVIYQDPQKVWLRVNGFERIGGFAEASDLLDVNKIDYQEYISRFADHSGIATWKIERDFLLYSRPDHEVIEIIGDLNQRGYQLCLLSNANAIEIRPKLHHHDLETLFDHIIISSEVGIRKPDPKIFQLALDRLGSQPEETIFVDDSHHNISAAQALGIGGIVHTDGTALRKQLNLRQPHNVAAGI